MFATTSLIVLATLAPHAFALPGAFRRPSPNIRLSADTNSTGVFGPDSDLWAQMTPYYPVADYVPPPSNCEIDQVSAFFRSNRGHEARRLVARGWRWEGMRHMVRASAACSARRPHGCRDERSYGRVLPQYEQIAGLFKCLEWRCGPEVGVDADIERERCRVPSSTPWDMR